VGEAKEVLNNNNNNKRKRGKGPWQMNGVIINI
jgi:hypothetical protein